MGFDITDAASIGIIGAADGPTSILVSQMLNSKYVGAIAVAAYSYMALVPIIQPFAQSGLLQQKNVASKCLIIRKSVSRMTRILFSNHRNIYSRSGSTNVSCFGRIFNVR